MRKSKAMLALEEQYGKSIQQLIMDALTTQGTIDRAAASLGVHTQTFYGWMIRLRIQVKKIAVVA